ncbi:MAG: enoyl-CoA hydratase/isomerase family protein [Candidatus Lambdaproteobacteria bacterium]|nr:enoyl-CoA hydratase/isomerase family protein [Candidatus Lambdaproteobacteria bacterium]
MDYQTIRYEVAERILTLTLNRPQKLNAFNQELFTELLHAFDRADADDDVRAIIVTGAGRAFCAGADLSGGEETFRRNAERSGDAPHRETGGVLTLRIFDCTKPVIAAINGPAIGVGLTMTLGMDIRLAADSARFGLVFARVGIVPEACSSWFLPRLVGISQALRWIYSGEVFGADEALAHGLVSEVHPADGLLAAARALALQIAANTSALSVALSRQMLWKMLAAEHPMAAHRVESRVIRDVAGRADAQEGIRAFLEKRPPRFTASPSADLPAFYPWWEPPRFEG